MAVVEKALSDPGMLSPEEIQQEIEDRCRVWLGLTVEEFQRRRAAGELPDTPAVGHILMLFGVGA